MIKTVICVSPFLIFCLTLQMFHVMACFLMMLSDNMDNYKQK